MFGLGGARFAAACAGRHRCRAHRGVGPGGVFSAAVGPPPPVLHHASALRGAEGTQNLTDLVRTYFRIGGQQLQVDVVDADTLRAAQERPEEYQDLLVRVAGYSARFVDLSAAMQEEFIARTEQSELR